MPTLDTAPTIDLIADKVFSGQRISAEDALALYHHPNLIELATLANERRQQRVPDRVVTYVIGRILNYTNVCWVRCKFCAFYRTPSSKQGYLWSDDEILQKVQETVDLGGQEILFQGGLNPDLKIDYFEGIFKKIKSRFPDVILHALSPAEIIYVAHRSSLTLEQCLERLRLQVCTLFRAAEARSWSIEFANRLPLTKTPLMSGSAV
jgi:cyclic dehypoxanthinyl futalosine synthase